MQKYPLTAAAMSPKREQEQLSRTEAGSGVVLLENIPSALQAGPQADGRAELEG